MKSLFLALTLLCLTACHNVEPAKASPWVALAIEDLRFIHDTLRTNTPNAVDAGNGDFNAWLEQGFVQSVQMARSIDSLDGLLACLRFYVSGFKDPHITIAAASNSETLKWPGFIVKYVGERLRIAYIDPQASFPAPIAVNDLLLAVDNRFPKQLIMENIFPFHNLPDRLESSWRIVSPYLFVDDGNPFVTVPKSIFIKTRKGEYAMPLAWTPIPAQQFEEKLRQTIRDTSGQWSIKSFADGQGAWISMPYFGSKDAAKLAQMQEVIGNIPSLRNKKYLVLDVRGNGGGQSFWGTQVLEGIYGRGFIEKMLQVPGQHTYDEWRVSKDNLAELKNKYLPFLKEKTGEGSAEVQYIAESIANMEKALAQGTDGLVKAEYPFGEPPKDDVSTASLFSGKVVLLTDAWCGSSCLTFAAEALRLPGIIHVGQTTSGYSPYVEARQVEIPSKNGTLIFPMKVVRDSNGVLGQPFTPKILYIGDINNTSQLVSWVENLLQR